MIGPDVTARVVGPDEDRAVVVAPLGPGPAGPPGVVTFALLRAVPRTAVLFPTGFAVGIVLALSPLGADAAVVALQSAIVALAAAAVALIDEPPLPAVPISRPRRWARLLGVGVPALGLLWLSLLMLAGVDGEAAGTLSLQLATVVAIALGAGAVVPVAIVYLVGVRLFFEPGWWAVAACAGLLALAARSRD